MGTIRTPRDNAWPYRDYVIRSFNEDKPYARFVKEQLAGDVLFPDQPDGTVATGFISTGPFDDSSRCPGKRRSTKSPRRWIGMTW